MPTKKKTAKKSQSKREQGSRKKVGDISPEERGQFLGDLQKAEFCLGIEDQPGSEVVGFEKGEPRLLIPGISDIEIAEVSRLGRREKFPRPHDWENLLPMLSSGDELLWIASKRSSRFRFHLGLKRNAFSLEDPLTVRNRRNEFRSILGHFTRRAFPESHCQELDRNAVDDLVRVIVPHEKRVTLVSGVPSPKTLEQDQLFSSREESMRLFASLNDVLEPFIEDDPFTVVFSVARASSTEINDEINRYTSIVELLHPFIEQQVSENQSRTSGGQRGTSKGISKGQSEQEQFNVFLKVSSFFAGTHNRWTSEKKYSLKNRRSWAGTGRNVSENETENFNEGVNWSTQAGASLTTTKINARFRLIHDAAERLLTHLKQTPGTGGYYVSAAIYSESASLGEKIGNALAGALSGSDSYTRPFQVTSYAGEAYDLPLRRAARVKDFFPEVALVSNSQASQFLMVPEADMPGISIKKNVFYGQTALSNVIAEEGAIVGSASYLENTEFAESERLIRIPEKDLLSHLLVTGTTGSGKTIRSTQILNALDPDQFRLIVIETAKKTYRNKLAREGMTPQILTVGRSDQNPLRINPFFFDEGTSLKRHISVLSDALSDLLPVEALIGPKLREAITECYFRHGWNLETSIYEGDTTPSYPSMIDFNAEVLTICEQLRYGPELTQNYLGALTGRSKIFVDDVYQDIFSAAGNIPFTDLFSRDTIIELDELPPSEIQMPSFLLSIIIERLRAFRSSCGDKESPYYLLVIEEAHNLLGRKLENPSQGNEMGSGSRLLEQTVRLLQEGRELGIGVFVIDQSPQTLADAVIKNTNTKIIHRMIDIEEASVIGKAIGLDEEEWPDLAELGDGECILKTKAAGKATKLAPYADDEIVDLQREPLKLNSTAPNYQAARRRLDEIARCKCSVSELIELANQFIEELSSDLERCDFVIGRYGLDKSESDRRLIRSRSANRGELLRKLFLVTANISDSTFACLLLMDAFAGKSTSSNLSEQLTSMFGDEWLLDTASRLVADLTSQGTPTFQDEQVRQLTLERLRDWAGKHKSIGEDFSPTEIFLRPLRTPLIYHLLISELILPESTGGQGSEEKESVILALASNHQWHLLLKAYQMRTLAELDHFLLPVLYCQSLAFELAEKGHPELAGEVSEKFYTRMKESL